MVGDGGNKGKQQQSRVTLWGVTGSGKSWMVNAFAKELEWYNRFDKEFSYNLYEYDENNNSLKPYSSLTRLDNKIIEANIRSTDKVWVFERKFRASDLRHRVSTHQHKIIIHDNAGADLTVAAGGRIDTEVDQLRVEAAIKTLEVADGVALLLDPTSVEGTPVATVRETLKRPRSEYEELITQVLEMAVKDKGKDEEKLRVAVCLSKSDSLQLELTPKDLVEVIFGKDLVGYLNTLEKLGKLDIRYFRFSAVGSYFDEKGIKRPNLTDDGNGVANENAWNPVHAASPFFWIFEAIERKRVAQPVEGAFRLLLADRKELYIPYAIRKS
jgi:hypothetical protein